MSVEEIEAARAVVPIATVQNLYNLANRQSEDVLDHCEAHGIGFIPWFPLAAGKLADPGGPLATAAERHGVSPGAVALAWLLHRSPVMLPIPGTGKVAHLEENMARRRPRARRRRARRDRRRRVVGRRPVAALLALLSAGLYGVGDFCGGLGRRALVGRRCAVLVARGGPAARRGEPADGRAPTRRPATCCFGALGGLAGAAGVGLLYQALAIGPMSVVAPTTALLAAAGAGARRADRGRAALDAASASGWSWPSPPSCSSAAEGDGSLRPSDLRGLTFALGAGLGFGLFFVALSHTADDAGTWPLLGARSPRSASSGLLALLGRVDLDVPPAGGGLAAVAGALDVTANLLYLLAVREGLLSVVSVLGGALPRLDGGAGPARAPRAVRAASAHRHGAGPPRTYLIAR